MKTLQALVVTATILVSLAAFPALASAQGCGLGSLELLEARTAVDDAMRAYVEALKAADPNLAAKEQALRDASRKARDLEAKPCIDASGGLVKTSSLKGVIVKVDFDKPFMDFYSHGPVAAKARNFSPNWVQAAGGAGRSGRVHFQLSFIGEGGFDHGGGATLVSFLGGVRVTVLQVSPKLAPFGQFLVGVEHCGLCQYTAFSLQPGFGVKYALRPRLGLLAQLDFRLVPSSENEIRLSGGVSIPIGK